MRVIHVKRYQRHIAFYLKCEKLGALAMLNFHPSTKTWYCLDSGTGIEVSAEKVRKRFREITSKPYRLKLHRFDGVRTVREMAGRSKSSGF